MSAVATFLSSIPSEVVTGLVSGALGVFAKIQSAKVEAQKAMLEVARTRAEIANESANAAANRGGKWVRRILALLAGFYLFGWPPVWAILHALGYYIPTEYLYNQDGGGFWIWSKGQQLYHAQVFGFVITPLHTHLASAVFFFYFGAGVTGRK